MRTLTLLALIISGGALTLETDYTKERGIRVVVEATHEIETTEMEVLIDGEPREFGGGRGGAGRSSSVETSITTIDTVVAHDDGTPTEVLRVFEEITSTATMGGGEESREFERESPLDGVSLMLTLEDDEVIAEVAEGDEPDQDGALEGHSLTLALDALLPEDEVEEGDSWDLDSEAARRILGLDVERALFARPEGGGGERGGRGGGGGGRRGPGGRSSGTRFLAEADWEGSAEVVSEEVEYEGVSCCKIELELMASGELEDTGFGGRRDRMDGAHPELAAGPFRRETEYEVELEGTFWFCIEDGRPVALELSGPLSLSRHVEGESRGGGLFEMHSEQEGELAYSVLVEEAEPASTDDE